jgi:Ni,Fe-hydrogenase I large subunit
MVSNARDMHVTNFGAIEQSDGSYIDEDGEHLWYNEAGDYHREDGPASIHMDGDVYWYLNGLNFRTFESWLNAVNVSPENKMILKLQYA